MPLIIGLIGFLSKTIISIAVNIGNINCEAIVPTATVGEYDYMIPWDNELANLGAKIIKYRLDYVEELSVLSGEIYKGISSGRETFSFHYDFSKENISEEKIKERN